MITQGSIILLMRFLTAHVEHSDHLVFNDTFEVGFHYEGLQCEFQVQWGHNLEQQVKSGNTQVLCNYGLSWHRYDLEVFVYLTDKDLVQELGEHPSKQLVSDFKQFHSWVAAVYEEDRI